MPESGHLDLTRVSDSRLEMMQSLCLTSQTVPLPVGTQASDHPHVMAVFLPSGAAYLWEEFAVQPWAVPSIVQSRLVQVVLYIRLLVILPFCVIHHGGYGGLCR